MSFSCPSVFCSTVLCFVIWPVLAVNPDLAEPPLMYSGHWLRHLIWGNITKQGDGGLTTVNVRDRAEGTLTIMWQICYTLSFTQAERKKRKEVKRDRNQIRKRNVRNELTVVEKCVITAPKSDWLAALPTVSRWLRLRCLSCSDVTLWARGGLDACCSPQPQPAVEVLSWQHRIKVWPLGAEAIRPTYQSVPDIRTGFFYTWKTFLILENDISVLLCRVVLDKYGKIWCGLDTLSMSLPFCDSGKIQKDGRKESCKPILKVEYKTSRNRCDSLLSSQIESCISFICIQLWFQISQKINLVVIFYCGIAKENIGH